ncbi:MAG: 50S ribosomal protein L21 [Salinisphaeraceae bacterium]|nr:50S ribosomal protein L21 [Salinisphaeraceae bacterium]
MHAVIRTGGKQYRVAEGDVLRVEKLDSEPGSSVELGEVLMFSNGDSSQIGTPLVEGGAVTAEITRHGRADKIDVVKFKRRKKYRRLKGHRQHFTEVKITGFTGASV